MTTIQFKQDGRRLYLIGNTFPIKDPIKKAGGHWDPDARAWWIGTAKKEEIEKALQATQSQAPSSTAGGTRPVQEIYDGPVIGKAEYKARQYYVMWHGRTFRGTDAFHLVSLDGKLDFWADANLCNWTKRYEKKGAYGRVDERYGKYPSLSGIRRYVASLKTPEGRADADDRAAHPGDRRAPGGKTCSMCGSAYCEGAWSGGLCEQD